MVHLLNNRVRRAGVARRALSGKGALLRGAAPFVASALSLACACERGDAAASSPTPTERSAGDAAFAQAPAAARVAAAPPRGAPSGSAQGPARASNSPEALAKYPWLAERRLGWPEPVDRVDERFAPPPGFVRAKLAPDSFGAWLRALPLAAEGSEVRSFRGGLVREAGHPNVAAVAALDVGGEDVQQCADSIMRLHAEWRWSRGDRAVSYRAASGASMPFERWSRGERPLPEGLSLRWQPRAAPGGGYLSFRAYLTEVFRYANTGSLAAQGEKVAPGDMRPGDFFVLPGAPGHAVLVVDMAADGEGGRAALLAQGFMPAQSFHVLRPDAASSAGGAWFRIDPASPGVKTPFWPTFVWSSLRRLDT